MAEKTIALIVAAGESLRAGGDIPKQYQMLDGKSLLRRTIEAFMQHPDIAAVKVVINPAHTGYYEQHTRGLDLLPPAHGGATRQTSVAIGLQELAAEKPYHVLVHDAARPNITQELIGRVVAGLSEYKAVIPALPVFDTLKHVEGDMIVGTIERGKLFRAQTPQGFHYDAITEAHAKAAGCECTDDAAVAEYAGLEVRIVPGSQHNYKITTQEDMQDMRLLLESTYETRIGSGFDVHAIVREGNRHQVTLCGVRMESGFALAGHSDADAGLHALVDAILGAIAEGDIGTHFPPSDERWRGADSALFVRHAMGLLQARRGRIINADITIICEKPAISPHRAAMVQVVAALLETDPSRISIKATTTEKLGFTGRGEGIAAQAIVMVKLPVQ